MKLINVVEKANEFIRREEPIQKSWYGEFTLDFPKEIFGDDIELEIVSEDDITERRHYEMQDIVFEMHNKDESIFIKVNLVSNIYDEMCGLSDVCKTYSEIKIVKPKKVEVIKYLEVEEEL